jgi:anthranilate phosphoribosyltransferase
VKGFLARLADGAILSAAESEACFGLLMDGAASAAQIAALITALRIRGETPGELRGAVMAARARMARIAAPEGAIDVCGTGGDGLATLNISTAVAFVVSACGAVVAKHGNTAISSRCGAADVLRELGVSCAAGEAEARLARNNLAFLFAPDFHPALRHAAAARSELGFRSLFNLIGPAANPAGVRRQLVGVFSPRWMAPMAETLGALGAVHVWVVHGGGLDELSLDGETEVCEWRGETMRRFTVTPEQAGLPRYPTSAIAGGGPAQNAAALAALLRGEPGAYRDSVLLNAAAALIVAGLADDLAGGAALARRALDSGAARARLAAAQAPVAHEEC